MAQPNPSRQKPPPQKPSQNTAAGFDFESAMVELEGLVTAMEEGELSLEESMKAFEKGVKLTRQCQQALKEAEQKVQVLLNESGDTEPMDTEAEDEQ